MLPLLLLLASAPIAPSQPTTHPAPRAVVTCSSVSRSVIEFVIGRQMQPASQETNTSASTCVWSAADAEVTVSVQQLASGFDLSAELRNLRAAVPEAKVSEVEGIGQRAIALEIEGAGAQLHILPGAQEYVMISVLGNSRGSNLRAAAAIAHALLER